MQNHEILSYFLDIFFKDDKDKVRNFSQIKTWMNNEFAFQESIKGEEKYIGSDSSIIIDHIGSGFLEDLPEDPPETKGTLEKVVTDTLIDGAKAIGKMLGAVDNDIKNVATELNPIGKPRTVKVKVIGPKKTDFLCDIIDFLPSELFNVIETNKNDYDVGIYAFTHENWGNLENVKELLPTEKYRIACNIGPQDGDICMEPLFFDVWEFEKYEKQAILSKLREFA